jgi:hypothetical protein
MARYSIMVQQHGCTEFKELLQVNSNPQEIVNGLHKKKLTVRKSIFEAGKRKTNVPLYSQIRIVDHGDDAG